MCRERVYENSSLSMSGFVQEVPSFLYLYITQCSTNLYAAAWSSAAYRVRFSAFLCLFPDVNQLTDTRYNASITRSRAHCRRPRDATQTLHQCHPLAFRFDFFTCPRPPRPSLHSSGRTRAICRCPCCSSSERRASYGTGPTSPGRSSQTICGVAVAT